MIALFGAVHAEKLPEDFLVLEAESKAPAKPYEAWVLSDQRTAPLILNPCFTGHWDKGRLMARTITFIREADYGKREQLVVYKDVGYAKAAMKGIRARLNKCADVGKGHSRYRFFHKPLDLGDEGIRAGARFFHSGSHEIAVRRGAAIMLYGESAWPTRSLPLKGFRPLIKNAEEMLGRVCQLPESAC